MTLEVDDAGNGKLVLQISVWIKIAVSVLAASMALGGALLGHVAAVAHHDQAVDDAIARLDSAVVAIRAEEAINSEARIRAIVELKEVNQKLDQILAENRVLLKKQEREDRHVERP